HCTPRGPGVCQARAAAPCLRVRWLLHDMRDAIKSDPFDIIVNLFTSFGYFAEEADDRLVVRAAASMLKPDGRFLLEVINGERLMASCQEREWFTVGQIAVTERRSLDAVDRRMV